MGVKIGMSVDPERARMLGLVDDEPDPPEEPLPPVDDAPELLHAQMVRDELRRMRARADARTIIEAERRGPVPPFDFGTLAEVLARPAPPASRVDQLVPWEAGTLVAAQRKTGKTSLTLNLARSLLKGEDFLGRFGVRPVDGLVAILNYEVSGAMLAGWAADLQVPADRLLLVNLRGRSNPLGDPENRGRLAGLLRGRGVETVMVDPFGRAYTGASQNDAGEVGGFLADLDRFARAEVGALDLVLTAHAGWNGERTRGSTALEDWADSIITLTRDDAEDGQGERYLRAIGRDVDVEEDRLSYDRDTRTLTLAAAGSRQAARAGRTADRLRDAIVRIVGGRPGCNGTDVEKQLRDDGVSFRRGEERTALGELVAAGRLVRTAGKGPAKLYWPPSDPDTSPDLPGPPRGDAGEPPRTLPIGGGTPTGSNGPATSPPGKLCLVCGNPMTVVEAGQTTHPGCDPDAAA